MVWPVNGPSSTSPLRIGSSYQREVPPAVHVDEALLAAIALKLAREPAAWVRRRVETIGYVADETIRRHMSVDFVLPHPDPQDPDDPFGGIPTGCSILVPLWLPPKEPVTNLDAFDEGGTSLSILNTRDNGRMAALALKALIAQQGHQLDAEQEEIIETIATRPADEAAKALKEAAPWMDRVVPPTHSARALIKDLAEAYMLLVPIHYAPGQHRVIKWSVDTPQPWETVESPSNHPRLVRGLEWLGVLDKIRTVGPISIGLAESHHVEIVAPEEVLVSEAFMSTRRWTASGERSDPIASTAVQEERAHLNVGVLASREDAEKARGDQGIAIFRLRARRSGTFIALAITTLIMAIVITVVAVRIGEIDVTTAAAVLLAFPAVVAAYLARPGEHAFATRLLAGARATALVCALCSLIAAALIATGLLHEHRRLVTPAALTCRARPAPVGRAGGAKGSALLPRPLSCQSTIAVYEDRGLPVGARWLLIGVVVVSWLGAVVFGLALWASWLLDTQDEEEKLNRREALGRRLLPEPLGGGVVESPMAGDEQAAGEEEDQSDQSNAPGEQAAAQEAHGPDQADAPEGR